MQADTGIAMGTGTDIAMEAADVTVIKGNLHSVVTAYTLSRATMRVIKENLFWAFGYNAVLIPMAILSPLIPFLKDWAPMYAAAAMALSSVTVVSNCSSVCFSSVCAMTGYACTSAGAGGRRECQSVAP